jgi:hypothetical protein
MIAAGRPAMATEAGLVTWLTGTCTATRDGETRALHVGATVHERDSLRTVEGARLRVALADGSTLSLGEGSQLVLTTISDGAGGGAMVFDLLSGIVRAILGPSPPEIFSVAGRAAVAAARSTAFIVETTTRSTAVFVATGTVGGERDLWCQRCRPRRRRGHRCLPRHHPQPRVRVSCGTGGRPASTTCSRARPRRAEPPMRRPGLVAFGLFLLALMLAYARWHDSGVFRALDHASFDLRLKLRPAMSPGDEVAILVIDDASLQRLGHWPPPRTALAATFEALAAAGASVVALDLLLLEPGPDGPDNDAARLVAAVERQGKPVLAMAFGFAEPVPVHPANRQALIRDAIPITRTSPAAVDLLASRRVCSSPSTRSPSTAARPCQRLRRAWGRAPLHPPGHPPGRQLAPCLAVQAAALHRDLPPEAQVFTEGQSLRLGEAVAPLDTASRLVINPYGPPGTFPHHPSWPFSTARWTRHSSPKGSSSSVPRRPACATGSARPSIRRCRGSRSSPRSSTICSPAASSTARPMCAISTSP